MWTMRRRLGLLVLCGVTLLAGCGDDDDGTAGSDGGGLCTSAAVSAALAAAGPGDVVSLGACRVTGPFTVPASVRLRGAGVASSVVVAPADGVALTLVPGAAATPTQLQAITIESAGRAAVVIKGAGAAGLDSVNIAMTKGVGVATDQSTVTLQDVNITGDIEPADALTLPLLPDPASYPAHGLVAIGGDLTLRRFSASKLAATGVSFSASTASWAGGSACDNAGIGVRADGGTLLLTDVTACRTLQSGLNPVFGMLFTGGVVVTSSGVKLMDNERFGIAHVGSNGSHTDLVGMRNGDPAVWVQESTSFQLKGAGSMLVGNKFNALVVRDSSNVTLRDAMITDTVMQQRTTIPAPGQPSGPVTNGDGIQLVRATASVVQDVTLVNNGRIGMLLDVGSGSIGDVQIMGRVPVSGPANGALMQSTTGMVALGTGGWDSAVIRDAATLARDTAASMRLGTVGVGVISPQILPSPLRALADLRL